MEAGIFNGTAALNLEDRLEPEPEIFKSLNLSYLNSLINNTGRAFYEEKSRLDNRTENLHNYVEMLDFSEEISLDDFNRLAQLKEDLAKRHCSYYWGTKYDSGKIDTTKVKDTLGTLNEYLAHNAERLGIKYLDSFVPEHHDEEGIRTDYLKEKFQHRLNLLAEHNANLNSYKELGRIVFDERTSIDGRLERISHFFDCDSSLYLGKLCDDELEILSTIKQKMEQKWKHRPDAQYVMARIEEENLYNKASNKLGKILPFPVEPEDIRETMESLQEAIDEAQESTRIEHEFGGEEAVGGPLATLHATIHDKTEGNAFVDKLKKWGLPSGYVYTKLAEVAEKASQMAQGIIYV